MEIILIVGYGSRNLKVQHDFQKVIELVQKKSATIVEGTSLKDIPETIKKLSKNYSSLKTLKIIPLFLFAGIHITKDIPLILEREREKYPFLNIKLGKHIGADPLLGDILIKRVHEI